MTTKTAETHELWSWDPQNAHWLSISQGTLEEMRQGAHRRYDTAVQHDMHGVAYLPRKIGNPPTRGPEDIPGVLIVPDPKVEHDAVKPEAPKPDPSDPVKALLGWLIAMDEPDNTAGMEARRTVTLTEIIRRARLAETWYDLTEESPDAP